jgi:hypothetical protein
MYTSYCSALSTGFHLTVIKPSPAITCGADGAGGVLSGCLIATFSNGIEHEESKIDARPKIIKYFL